MNSINQGSKYKRKLTREIINKQIKHEASDFPTVSFICLPISIIFLFVSFHLFSLFFFQSQFKECEWIMQTNKQHYPFTNIYANIYIFLPGSGLKQ